MIFGSTHVSKPPAKGKVELVYTGADRWSVMVDGLVTYTGPKEECERRVAMRLQPNSRPAQNQALGRAIGIAA